MQHTIRNKNFEFNYSEPKKATLACEQRYYTVVTAPKHGLEMGSIIYFTENKPTQKTIDSKLKSEMDFHIRVGNVK